MDPTVVHTCQTCGSQWFDNASTGKCEVCANESKSNMDGE